MDGDSGHLTVRTSCATVTRRTMASPNPIARNRLYPILPRFSATRMGNRVLQGRLQALA